MRRRRRLIVLLAGSLSFVAPAWAQTSEGPAGNSAELVAPPTEEWMGPPRPSPAGLDPSIVAIDGRDPVRASLWRAWSAPDVLERRVARLERAGLSAGIGSLDAAARALLLEPSLGDPLERAELAVRLAPGLPAAHAALAREQLARGHLLVAFDATREAAEAALGHLEARLWLEATAHDVLFDACLAGALGFLALAAAAAFPRFASDLARLREVPGPSAGALALSLVLAPVAFGEGLAGLGFGLLAFSLVNGSAWRRLWALSAAALLVAALFPLLERRVEHHAALARDPIALAAWMTEHGVASATELARVVRAADADPLAARALALRLAQQGELAEAERRFDALLREDSPPELIANVAGVRLLRGDAEAAIALYERAVRGSDSAVIRFDLAQAYGRAIRLDAQDLALAEAQSIDPDVLSELNHRYDGRDGALVAYLPLPVEPVLARLEDPATAAALAHRLRQPLAPGVAGESRGDAVVALWLAAGLGLLLGSVLRRLAGPEADLYQDLARQLQASGGDSVERMAQLAELQRRQARRERAARVLAWLVPGAAGMVAGRPLLAGLSVAVAACAGSLWVHRHGAVPDPLALGALPGLGVALALVLLAIAHLTLIGVARALREKN